MKFNLLIQNKKIVRLIKKIVRNWFYVQLSLAHRLGKRWGLSYTMNAVCSAYEKIMNEYCAYDIRPKKAEKFSSLRLTNPFLPSYAVVIQGPIMAEDDFTLETIRFYHKIFPDGKLIISTWDTTPTEQLKALEQEGALIVLSSLPKVSGLMNVNYQFVSALAGIRKAEELGCEYVFKTRSDQRIYRNNAYEMMYSLLKKFPCKRLDLQQERIVFMASREGNMLWSCHYNDCLTFGQITDMKQFYAMEEDLRFHSRNDVYQQMGETTSRICGTKEGTNAETFIIGRYLRKKQYSLQYNIQEHWKIASELFLCISELDLNLYWLDKYDHRFQNNVRGGQYLPDDTDDKGMTYNFDFFNWLAVSEGTILYDEKLERFQTMQCNAMDGHII